MKRLLKAFSFVILLSGLAGATTLTASDILSRARVYLRDQSTAANRQQFPDATLLQFLSDGQREANAQNWMILSSTTFTLSAGTTEYVMPDDFMATYRVWYQAPGQAILKIDQTSMDQLDAQSVGWTSASGTPTKYYLDKSLASVYMGFYPAPIASSTGPVIVYYVQQTADCTTTSCIPFNGNLALQPYASSLSYYIAYRGFLTVEETDLANVYFQYWVAFLQLMHQGQGKTPDFNPGFIGQHGSP